MHIYKDLFCDKKCEKNRRKLLKKIKYHAGLTTTYVIALSDNQDYFDLIPGYVLKQKGYPVRELNIMGLADGYDNAVELVIRMIEDFSQKYGTVYFKNFLVQDKELNFTGYNRK